MDCVYFHVATTSQQKAEAARFWERRRSQVLVDLGAESEDEWVPPKSRSNDVLESRKLMRGSSVAIDVADSAEEPSVYSIPFVSAVFRVIFALTWTLLLLVRRRREAGAKKECNV